MKYMILCNTPSEGGEKVENEHGGRKRMKVYGTQIAYEKVSAEADGFKELAPNLDLPFM